MASVNVLDSDTVQSALWEDLVKITVWPSDTPEVDDAQLYCSPQTSNPGRLAGAQLCFGFPSSAPVLATVETLTADLLGHNLYHNARGFVSPVDPDSLLVQSYSILNTVVTEGVNDFAAAAVFQTIVETAVKVLRMSSDDVEPRATVPSFEGDTSFTEFMNELAAQFKTKLLEPNAKIPVLPMDDIQGAKTFGGIRDCLLSALKEVLS